MMHDVMPDGSCSCGAHKKCPACGGPLAYIGYDNEPTYGVGHVWDPECLRCDEPVFPEEERGGEG